MKWSAMEQNNKQKIRKLMLAKRKAMNVDDVSMKSNAICEKLVKRCSALSTFVLYAAIGNEVSLKLLFKHLEINRTPYLLPRYNQENGTYELVSIKNLKQDCIIGKYGIREPRAELPALDYQAQCAENITWIIPGVSFSKIGARLGRGGGFYDRLLNNAKGLKIGVAYDWQIRTELPTSEFDIGVDEVITATQELRF